MSSVVTYETPPVTLYAAPPWMTDLMKMPRSSPVSLDLFPLRLMPRPAEPVSLRGTSNMSCSFPLSGTKPVRRHSSSFWEGRGETVMGTREGWEHGEESEVSSLGFNIFKKKQTNLKAFPFERNHHKELSAKFPPRVKNCSRRIFPKKQYKRKAIWTAIYAFLFYSLPCNRNKITCASHRGNCRIRRTQRYSK